MNEWSLLVGVGGGLSDLSNLVRFLLLGIWNLGVRLFRKHFEDILVGPIRNLNTKLLLGINN